MENNQNLSGKLEVKIKSENNLVENFRIIKQVTSYQIQGKVNFIGNGNYSLTEDQLKELIENKAKKIYGENVTIEYKEK
jgi:hypothetical protein